MSHVLALFGDAFAVMIMWRARKWIWARQRGMFETDFDVKMTKVAGWVVIAVCLFSIYANHFLLNF